MPSTASQIVTDLETIIAAATSGASLSAFYDKRIGDLEITRTTTLKELREQHKYWRGIAANEDDPGLAEQMTTYI